MGIVPLCAAVRSTPALWSSSIRCGSESERDIVCVLCDWRRCGCAHPGRVLLLHDEPALPAQLEDLVVRAALVARRMHQEVVEVWSAELTERRLCHTRRARSAVHAEGRRTVWAVPLCAGLGDASMARRVFSCTTHGAPDQQCTEGRCTVWECTMCGVWCSPLRGRSTTASW